MAKVKSVNEAVSVLVQVGELAQARGILTLHEAVLVHESIQLLKSLGNPPQSPEHEPTGPTGA